VTASDRGPLAMPNAPQREKAVQLQPAVTRPREPSFAEGNLGELPLFVLNTQDARPELSKDLERRALRLVLPGWETEPVTVHALHRREHRGSARVRPRRAFACRMQPVPHLREIEDMNLRLQGCTHVPELINAGGPSAPVGLSFPSRIASERAVRRMLGRPLECGLT